MGRAGEAVAVLPRVDDVVAAGAKGADKDTRKRKAKGGTRRRRAGRRRCRWGRPGAVSSSAASGLLDRRGENRAGASSLLPLPLPKRLTESAANQLTKSVPSAVAEAVQAINWLHGVDCRPRPVHSSSGFAVQRTSELHLEAQQRVEEAVL